MFLWPNWIRRLTTNQKIGGSSPSRNIFLLSCNVMCVTHGDDCVGDAVFADIAQLGERQTEDLKVPGSIPGVGIFLFWKRKPLSSQKLSTMRRRTMASWPSG